MLAGNPRVTGAQLIDSASDGGQRLTVTFSSDVGQSLSTADLLLRNLDSGQAIATANIRLTFDPQTHLAVFSFPGLAGGLLPDGNYRAILRGDGIQDAGGLLLDGNGDGVGGDDAVFAFSFLRGDVNRDRKVDADDLSAVNASIGSAGVRPQDGDFNGDGRVDFNDLVALAQHYNGPATRLSDGDANLDGVVDFNDLVLLAQHYNTSGVGDLNGDGAVTAADVQIVQANVGHQLAALAPVAASFPYDSGTSATDGISNNVTVDGLIGAAPSGFTLKAGVDGMPVGTFADVSPAVQPGGGFSLPRARLEQVAGAPLSDGAHVLHLRLLGPGGVLVGSLDLPFTLDTTAPVPPGFDLAPGYASAPGTTTFKAPFLAGTTEPNAVVSLGTLTATAGATGQFALSSLLSVGTNALTLTATDIAGNASTFTRTLTRVSPTTGNQVALDWNNATLAAIALDGSQPPVASRTLAMVSSAMYDAVNAVSGAGRFLYVRVPAPTGASDVAAVAQAAHDVLVYLYPGQQAAFDAQLAVSLASVSNGTPKSDGIAVGQQVAAAIIDQRADDGATNFVDYTPGTGTGAWQPTYPMYASALLPNWATLRPFMMNGSDQFRPAGPAALNGAQWVADYNQVKSLGSATSATRTADQTQIARFWADGLGTVTPAGHWNLIATQLLQAKGNVSLFDTLKLLAQLNVSMGDAAIVAWDAKYADSFWRPITAIRAGGANAALTGDANWTPLLSTPNFPEYISGHSTFSGAAAVILGNYFGADTPFSTTSPSPGVSGAVRNYASFDAAASEAGMSRIYGGIHYLTSDLDGLAAGRALGNYVLAHFDDANDTLAPRVTFANTNNAAVKQNVTIFGLVTDNLSGIKTLSARFDNGATFDVTVDSSGRFAISTALATNGAADGAHVLHLTGTDYAGNAANVDYTFTLDTAAPAITLTSPAGAQPIPLTPTTALAGTATGTGSPLVALTYQFDAGPVVPISFAAADGSFSQLPNLSNLGAGGHTIKLTATDAAGNTVATTLNVSLSAAPPLKLANFTPSAGAGDVGTTYRPQIFFSRPINPATLNNANFFATDTTGAKLAATIVPSNDGTYAWLFFTSPLPGASTIMVTVDGATIKAADNTALDAAGTGAAGSKLRYAFTTVATTTLPNTSLSGIVADPGPDLKPGTPDDVASGPDGVLMTADDVYKLPIAGVVVSVIGTNLSVVTDVQGRFNFPSVPSGDVKLAVTGNTATNAPAGFYFPEMVMDLNILAGTANTVMAAMARSGTGNAQPGAATTTAVGAYIPRLRTDLLQNVSAAAAAHIAVAAPNAPSLTTQQRSQLTLDVPAGSIVGMNGQPMGSAQIGVSTVDPSLVMDMLPPGVMQHTFDITVQAPGVATFSTPVAMTFPNVFNAAPGTKLNFLSFDHTTGRLVIEGTATVSADGLSVRTDPGTGVTHPGWHGLTQDGAPGKAKPKVGTPEPKPEPDPERDCDPKKILKDLGEISLGLGGTIAAVAGAPVWAAVATVGAAAFAAYDIYNEGPSLSSVNELLHAGFEGIGSLWGGIKLPVGRPVNVSRFFTDPILSPKFNKAARQLAKQAGEFGEHAGHLLGALGGFLSGMDLGGELVKCAAGALAAPLPGAPVPAPPAAPPTDKITAYLSQLDQTGAAVMQLIYDIIGAKLAPHLPSDRPVVFVAAGSHLRALELEGGFYIDPATQAPLDLPFASLIDDGYFTDPQSRTNAQQIGLGLDALRALVAPSSVPLSDALAQVNDLVSVGGQHVSEDLKVTLPVRPVYYKVTDFQTGNVIAQGKTDVSGQIDFFAGSNKTLLIQAFDPENMGYGEQFVHSGASGQTFGLGPNDEYPLIMVTDTPADDPDTDGDGLGDLVEQVIGTSPTKFSTTNDGISDGAKIIQGLDPLSGVAFPIGPVATLPLQGTAKAIDVAGSVGGTGGQTAYVATGNYGLAIVDVGRFDKPTLLGQLRIGFGDATDVAVDPNLAIAAVADNAGGLVLVDVADPRQPVLLKAINVNASHVRVKDGVAYATVGATLQSYDLATGNLLQVLSLGAAALTAVAREGAVLYTMDAANVLRAVDISGASMVARGSLTVPQGGGKVFVGNGIAYVSAASLLYGGYATVNVSNPNNLTLIAGSSATSTSATPGPAIVANGSGLGVMSVAGGQGVGPSVTLFNVSNPAVTSAFLTTFALPQPPSDLTLAGGIAFVADGLAGLQVVNYRPFDNLGVPPTAAIDTTGLDTDAVTPGIQAVEGSTISIRANVADDAQVRNVELLVNGLVVQNAVSFPFNLSTTLPTLASGATTLTLQVRATDTGGNVTTSAPVLLNLVRDTTPPHVVAVNPPEGSTRGQGPRAVQVSFSKGMDPATLVPANFTLTGAGNVTYTATGVHIRNNASQFQLTFPSLAPGNYTLTIHAAAIKDFAGNVLGASDVLSHFNVALVTATFVNPAGGFWDDPNNWDTHQVPGIEDDVAIEAGVGATVTIRGNVAVRSIIADSPVSIVGGVVTVSNTLRAVQPFTMTGGMIRNTTVEQGPGGVSRFFGNPALDGVTLNGDFLVGRNTLLDIQDGLTVNGTVTLGDANGYGVLHFQGSQTLGGAGTVIFGTAGPYNTIMGVNAGDVVTIGPGVTVRGVNGTLGYNPSLGGGSSNTSVVNQGTIQSDTPGAAIAFDGANSQNLGTLKAINGGQLSLGNLTNAGTISVDSTSTIAISGNVVGGTINAQTGAQIRNGTLVGVTINGAVTLGRNTFLSVQNGLTLNGTITLGDAFGYGVLRFVGSQTLGGNGTVVFGTNGAYNTMMGANAGDALTIGPGITVRGQSGTLGYNPSLGGGSPNTSIINRGTIQADTAGSTITVGAASSQNFGTIKTLGGGQLTIGALTNAGTLSIDSAGTLSLTGTLTGGTLTAQAGARLSGGTLDGITISGALTVGRNAFVDVRNGITLNGTVTLGDPNGYGVLRFQGSQTLGGAGTVLFGTGSPYNTVMGANSGDVVTIGPGITVKGQHGALGYNPSLGGGATNTGVINQGTIQIAAGGNIVDSGTLVNQGTVTVDATSSFELGGTLSGGVIVTQPGAHLKGMTLDNVTVNGDFVLAAGNIAVTNGLTLNGAATIGDATGAGYLQFLGSQTLGGTGSVLFGSAAVTNALWPVNSGTTLTIGSQLTVHGRRGTLGYNPNLGGSTNVSIVNLGHITADVAGGTIDVSGVASQNQGTLAAAAGGNLSISGSLTNTGTVNVDGVSSLGGGNGTLAGGSLVTQTGALLSNITLDAVSQTGNARVAANANVIVTRGLTLGGTLTLGDPSGYGALRFVGSQTLGGAGSIVFGSADVRNSLWPTDAGTALTIGSGVTVKGQRGVLGYNPNLGGSPDVSVVNRGAIQWVNGGNITDTGTLTNLGTISVDAASTLAPGGTILGGVINTQAGAHLASVTLDGVTVSGDFTVTSGDVSSVHGLTITGRLALGDNSTSGSIRFNGSQTLGGPGTVVFGAAANNALWFPDAASTLTIGPDLTVRGQRGTIGYTANLGGSPNVFLVNLGAIKSDVSGGIVTLSPITGENRGSLVASAGGNLTINGQFTNTGSITVDAVSSLTGAGAIVGGAIQTQAGALIQNIGLDGVTIAGDARVAGNANVSVTHGLTLGGILTVGDASGYGALRFSGSQTLGGAGSIVFGSGDSRNSLWPSDVGTALTIGSGVTVKGQRGTLGYNPSLGGSSDVFVNNFGTIQWMNGGTITDTGTLTNAGTLTVDATSTLSLGGTVVGGAIVTQSGARLNGTTLDGVTVNGDFTIASGNITALNGLTLNGTATLGDGAANGYIHFIGSQTLGGSGAVLFGSAANNALWASSTASTLTLGPGITVHGAQGTIGYNLSFGGSTSITVVNRGAIVADVAGRSIALNTAATTNFGTIRATAGTLNVTGDLTNSGLIRPGGPGAGGPMTVSGSFTQTAIGVLNIDISGSVPGTQFGQLLVTGAATLAGTVNVKLTAPFLPTPGATFPFLTYTSRTGAFDATNDLDPTDGIAFGITYNAANATLTAAAGAAPTPAFSQSASSMTTLAAPALSPTVAKPVPVFALRRIRPHQTRK